MASSEQCCVVISSPLSALSPHTLHFSLLTSPHPPHRDEGIFRFVRYVSAAAPGSRWDVSAEFEVALPQDESDDSDDEEEEGEEEGEEEEGGPA